VLRDTLDPLLQEETFQLLNYSHPTQVSLKGRALAFSFKDIQLPDSNSNEKESHGFVQYRIKPISGLPKGTKIKNTAYIYFDFNAAVVTNTTVNEFVDPVNSITKIGKEGGLVVYPNPGSGVYKIKYPDGVPNMTNGITVYNVLGEKVYESNGNNENMDLSDQANGIYYLKAVGENLNWVGVLVKE
jgi:hypothetical protein